MRILYVCSDFGIPVYGHKGASIHLRSISKAFAELGHEIEVLSPNTERQGNDDFTVSVRGLTLDRASARAVQQIRKTDKLLGQLPNGWKPRTSQEVRNLLYNQTLLAEAETLGARGYDFVYERYSLFSYAGIELARILEVPHVLEVNAPLVLEQEQARGLQMRDIASEIEKRVWNGTDALLLVSNELKRFAIEQGVSESQMHVVPNGVDGRAFENLRDTRGELRQRLGYDGETVFGFVGSLKAWHGTEVLLRAFAGLQAERADVRLLIVGDGPMRDEIQRLTATLGLEGAVQLLGAVDHAEVPGYLAAMDIGVAPYLPSDDFYFSPIKVFEYLAAGLPVIASEIGQMLDLEGEIDIALAEPGSVSSLQSAMKDALAQPLYSECVQKNRRWVLEHRTWKANAARILEIANSLQTTGA